MKILVLNLPYKRKIIRKYSCSYYANGFLYPPVELIRICTIIHEKSLLPHEVIFMDAIAENISFHQCSNLIAELKPDAIITMASVDFINEEYDFLLHLKKTFQANIILIGYLPALFPENYNQVDVILGNDFEQIIAKTFSKLESNNFEDIKTLIERNKGLNLEFNADIIPKSDNSFIKENLYSELFVRGKTAFTYFSFGCPYKCSFCIKTYNLHKVHYRNISNIFSELKDYWAKGIKNIRILDDNCTLNKQMLKNLLVFQQETNIHFNYYGLSRIDLLDEETIGLLKQLNFRSILIGIETINPSTMQKYNKKIDLGFEKTKKALQLLKLNKIEVTFFFLFNPVSEKKEDIQHILRFIKKLPINYASLTFMLPYPGTKFFEDNRDKIDFSLTPYYSSMFKEQYYKDLKRLELLFMFSFYFLKPQKIFFFLKKLILYPLPFSKILFNLLKFAFMSHKNRKDYF